MEYTYEMQRQVVTPNHISIRFKLYALQNLSKTFDYSQILIVIDALRFTPNFNLNKFHGIIIYE